MGRGTHERPDPAAASPDPDLRDSDPAESAEWRDALASVLAASGSGRARELMDALAAFARDPSIGWQPARGTPYVNTIAPDQQPSFPGDLAIEERLASLMRWNALAMVVRANQAYGELGGHIASYASAADLFEVGFNHFFRASAQAGEDDLVFYQPHSAPGVYARAFSRVVSPRTTWRTTARRSARRRHRRAASAATRTRG